MITKVSDTLYRGPSPQVPQDYAAILATGSKCTLDLETGMAVFGDNSPLMESVNAEACFIRLYPHPLGAVFAPTLREISMAIGFIKGKTADNQSVYIHCKHGVDRTGIICAYYRVRVQGWKVDDAIAEMYSMGFHRFPYQFWVPFLRGYLG